jgi:hypothetical protein
MTGLAAALCVQVMTLSASTTRGLALASFAAGVATGFRSQVVWLTMPLLMLRAFSLHHGGHRGRGGSGLNRQDSFSVSTASSVVASLLAFASGVLLWFVPLVVVSGGPAAYWHALFDQGAEDLGNIQMLWTRHDLRTVADALYYAFVGLFAAWRRAPRALGWLAAGFGPYLLFDLLFQETFTGRYALPLVVPMAYLAAAGFRWAPRQAVWLLVLPIILFDLYAGGASTAAYVRQKAPAFRLLDDMTRAAEATGQRPVLAPDRRESFDLRRPIQWVGSGMPPIVKQLAAPPQHEWLEAVR